MSVRNLFGGVGGRAPAQLLRGGESPSLEESGPSRTCSCAACCVGLGQGSPGGLFQPPWLCDCVEAEQLRHTERTFLACSALIAYSLQGEWKGPGGHSAAQLGAQVQGELQRLC